MVVTYTNTRGDLRAATVHHVLRARSTWISVALFVVATTLVTVSSIETDFGPVINVLTVIAIEVILVGGMVMLYAAMILVAVAFQRHPGTLTEHTVTVDADGFTESTDVNETVTKWPGVTGVRRTPRYLFVYLGPATAHVIPCRAFATQEDFNRFSEMVIQHWRVHAVQQAHQLDAQESSAILNTHGARVMRNNVRTTVR